MLYFLLGILIALSSPLALKGEEGKNSQLFSSLDSVILMLQNEIISSIEQLEIDSSNASSEYTSDQIQEMLIDFDLAYSALEGFKGKVLEEYATYPHMVAVALLLVGLDIAYSLQPSASTMDEIRTQITTQLTQVITADSEILWGGQLLYLVNYESLLMSENLIEILNQIRSIFSKNGEDTKELSATIFKLQEAHTAL